jgi:hypothetical protein
MPMNRPSDPHQQSHSGAATRFRTSAVGLALTVAAACTVAVAVAAGAPSTGSDSSATDVVSPAMPAAVALATVVQPDQAAAFTVLNRPRTAGDAMPAEARAQVGNGPQSGRNVDLSRAISTVTGRGWVIPGNGTVCLVVPDPVDGYALACNPTERASSGGVLSMLISSETPDVAHVTLLVPDESSVAVTMADGKRRSLAADADGVVSATLTRAKEIVVSTPAATSTIAMPVAPPQPPPLA